MHWDSRSDMTGGSATCISPFPFGTADLIHPSSGYPPPEDLESSDIKGEGVTPIPENRRHRKD